MTPLLAVELAAIASGSTVLCLLQFWGYVQESRSKRRRERRIRSIPRW